MQMRYQLIRRFGGMTRGFSARRFENPSCRGELAASWWRGGLPPTPAFPLGGNGKGAKSFSLFPAGRGNANEE
jgi:hypothetical protein